MPARKKRISSPKSALVAVQSQVSSLEDEQTISGEESRPSDPVVHLPSEKTGLEKEFSKTSERAYADTLEAVLSQDAQESELSKKNVWLYRFGIIGTGIVIVSSIMLYGIYARASSKATVPIAATPVVPTETPVAVIDPKTITIEVLNASGVSGKASKTAEILKAKGYTIVSTGNAKKIPSTSVAFSTSLSKKTQDLVLGDLLSMGFSSVSSSIVDSSISARIVLGLK